MSPDDLLAFAVTLCAADDDGDGVFSAADSIGTVSMSVVSGHVVITDNRHPRPARAVCRSQQDVRAALRSPPGAPRAPHTGTLITSLGVMAYTLSVLRRYHAADPYHLDPAWDSGLRVTLDAASPTVYGGQPVCTLRAFAYTQEGQEYRARVISTRQPGESWNHAPPPTLRAEGERMADDALNTVLCRHSERHARLDHARERLLHAQGAAAEAGHAAQSARLSLAAHLAQRPSDLMTPAP